MIQKRNDGREKPYISVVMNSRNDNYQGGGFKRTQMAVNSLIDQSKRHNLRIELILVDWNPPADKPLLKDVLLLPDNLGPMIVRFIVVPPKIHKKYNSSGKINIIVPAAYNVGIRRAKGEFILPTSSDILFSEELAQFLSLEKLRKDCFYRAVRCELPKDAFKSAPLKDQMDFWKKNIPMPNLEKEVSPHGLSEYPVLQTLFGADFILFPRENWMLIRGWPELNNIGLAADSLACYMAYLSGLKEELLKYPMRIYHIDHDSRWHALYKQSKVSLLIKDKLFNKLGLASDDKRVEIMKKIYRFERAAATFCRHFCYVAFRRQEKLDFDVKYITLMYAKILRKMLKGKRHYAYNDDSWGFPGEKFKEFVFHSYL